MENRKIEKNFKFYNIRKPQQPFSAFPFTSLFAQY